jgi:hypothetical protein
MEEELDNTERLLSDNYNQIGWDLMKSLVVNNKDIKFETMPINGGEYAMFFYSCLENGETKYKTRGNTLEITKDGKTIEIPNYGFIVDYLIGLAIFIKEKHLEKEFKEFFMF